MDKQASQEREASSANGFVYAIAGLLIALVAISLLVSRPSPMTGWAFGIGMLVAAWCLTGLYTLQPNQAALLTLFGSYRGTDRSEGLRWAIPFYVKKNISVRARNFNSEKLKVNDKRGNPIEIAVVVVWRVADTAQAMFDVDNYETYMRTQSESAVRHLASQYFYDDGEEGEATLRGHVDDVSRALRAELQERLIKLSLIHI